MRERLVLCGILTKRLLCKKSFWVLLCLFPLFALWVRGLEKSSETVVNVAVYAEDQSVWQEAFQKDEGLIRFYFCESKEQLKRDVVTKKAECGYVLTEDLQEKFAEDDWYRAVDTYESAGSMLTKVINETVFERIFSVISTKWYAGYIAEKGKAETEAVLQSVREQMRDKNTFSVRSFYVAADGEVCEAEEKGVFPLRGVVVACIFLCGLLGAVEVLHDDRRGYFLGKPQNFTALFTIWLPTAAVAAAGYIALLAAGQHSTAMQEFFYLSFCVLSATGYGFLFQWILKEMAGYGKR